MTEEIPEGALLTENDGHDFRSVNDIELIMTAEDAFDYGFEEGAKAQFPIAKQIGFEMALGIFFTWLKDYGSVQQVELFKRDFGGE